MHRLMIVLAAVCGLGGCAAAGSDASRASAALACPVLAGTDEVLAMRGKRYIIFGEMHGTAETPALFGDFVCHAARQGPVVVGLEISMHEQPALDHYLRSRGTAADRSALTGTMHWEGQDGRASVAMLALVERLRTMRSAGAAIRVHAFVDPGPPAPTQTPYEQRMAQQWRTGLAAVPGARLVALVGNIHARRVGFRDFDPAAMHLPHDELITIDMAPNGGSAWNCQQSGCAAHPLGRAGPATPRGIQPTPALPEQWGRFDRWLSPGGHYSASPPVRAPAS
jgi:hypothetical protein